MENNDFTQKSLLTDEQLVENFRAGDLSAFDEISERYKTTVRHITRSYFICGGDDEDLTQEGMIGLFKAVSAYNGASSFSTFAMRCVHSSVITAIKRAKRDKHGPLNDAISIEDITDSDVYGGDPAVTVIDDERADEFMGWVKDRLSKFEHKVFLLYLKGLKIKEICDETGKTYKSIDNALTRIRDKLTNSSH